MTTIRCRIFQKGKQCSTVFETDEPVLDSPSFVCKNHPRSVQVDAVKRTYDPVKDERDSDASFQNTQFDGDVDGSGAPEGTGHIPGARGVE